MIIINYNMPSANIYFDHYEDKKIRELSAKWNISKNETVKRIVKNFKIKEMRKTNDNL